MTRSSCIVFVGPTAFGMQSNVAAGPLIQLRPPVRRGDLTRLISSVPPGNLAIVDGTFHVHPSVGHAEIGAALRAGWNVWGLSSMGAIRACEMRGLGMRGYGRVYERFCADESFSDDEVTLLHSSDAPFAPLSEPLVHIREFLVSALERGLLQDESARAILMRLKHRWYGYRTLRALCDEVVQLLGEQQARPVLAEIRRDFDRYRIKTRDLVAFLLDQPWQAGPRSEISP